MKNRRQEAASRSEGFIEYRRRTKGIPSDLRLSTEEEVAERIGEMGEAAAKKSRPKLPKSVLKEFGENV